MNKKFDLWFPDPGHSAYRGAAYITVVNPFDDGSGQHALVNSKGHILLYEEALNAAECVRQIDLLIGNLQSLKAKAEREFKKREDSRRDASITS